MLPPLVSPVNLAILKKAVAEALGVAATQNVDLTVHQLAELIGRAFAAGERDPAKLAAAVFAASEPSTMH